jgi:ADP-heptose:LPS heptosyltransferase
MNRWAELSKQLTEEGCYVLLIGGSKERKEIEEKNVIFPREENIIDLVGKTSIKQSLTAINRCSLMVGAEGGMMHCASALGIKTLTIFGGSDYRVWNPGGEDSPIINLNYNCAPCFCTKEGAHCTHHDCLMKIDTKLVFDDIMSIIY